MSTPMMLAISVGRDRSLMCVASVRACTGTANPPNHRVGLCFLLGARPKDDKSCEVCYCPCCYTLCRAGSLRCDTTSPTVGSSPETVGHMCYVRDRMFRVPGLSIWHAWTVCIRNNIIMLAQHHSGKTCKQNTMLLIGTAFHDDHFMFIFIHPPIHISIPVLVGHSIE